MEVFMNTIENLPDDVITNILSRLSLKDAVRTSVLSKVWELKWTSIYKVDIDIEKLSPKSRNEPIFVSIASKVLTRLVDVKKCSLMCKIPVDIELSGITTLVSGVMMPSVKRLILDIHNTQAFFLPYNLLLSCATSLTKLILLFETPSSFRVPANAKNCFPNLKYLWFRRVEILNDISSTNRLIFTFPVLKTLHLINCKWSKVKFVEMYAPSLYTLTSLPQSDGNEDLDYSIEIYGTMLHELTIDHKENIIMNSSNVVRTNLDCTCDNPLLSLEERGLQVRNILRKLSNLECLGVSDLMAIGQTKLSLPRFHQLKSLCLKLDTPFDAEGVLELLHATPFLKSLGICLVVSEDYDYDSVGKIPSCIVQQLEEVTVAYALCPEPTFLVEKFLLKNGAHLKTVKVFNTGDLIEDEIIEKLSTFPKASEFLQIVGS